MLKFVLGTVGALAMAGSASAADIAAGPSTKAPMMVAMYDWSGFYIGGNGGWGSSHKCWDFTNAVGNFIVAEGCHDAAGGTAGGQVGYRWQRSAMVFGLEAQGNWAGFKGSNVSIPFPVVVNETRLDAFGLFTAQVGYSWNNALLYLKGGAALTADRYRGYTTATGIQVSDVVKDTRWGGAIGAGVEYGFTPNWSAAIEYDHLFMQDRLIGFTNNGVLAPAGTLRAYDRIHQDVDLVTVRVNYRWGGPVVARY